MKDGLKAMNVPFVHKYIEQYTDILNYYYALDLYLVTSREEGGPMGLLESMASVFQLLVQMLEWLKI